jgi:RHS repeat-associated protein
MTCKYDAWNRLVRVADESGPVAEYQYDGRNFRIVKKTFAGGQPAQTRHYYYNGGWQLLEERVEQSPIPNPQSRIPYSQHVWGLRYIDDLVLRDRDATGHGTLGERLYALQDPNWNVVAMAGASGTVVERIRYSAYGEPAFLTGTFSGRTASLYDVATLYCGYHSDAALKSYVVRNRVLWPYLGRWDRRDPILYKDGVNLYEYAGGRPVSRRDPSGRVVQVCTRLARAPGLQQSGCQHMGIKTPERTIIAVGPAGGGGCCANCPGAPTVTQDVTDDTEFDCVTVGDTVETGYAMYFGTDTPRVLYNCSDPCVSESAFAGMDCGRWGPFNNCQTYVYGILQSCCDLDYNPVGTGWPGPNAFPRSPTDS